MEKWQLLDLVEKFRRERLGKIGGLKPPADLPKGGQIVIHLLPKESIGDKTAFNDGVLGAGKNRLEGLVLRSKCRPNQPHFNAEGKLVPFVFDIPRDLAGYVQVFFDGTVESVTILEEGDSWPNKTSDLFLSEAIEAGLDMQNDIGIKPPIFAMISIIGTKEMLAKATRFDESGLELPPQEIISYEEYKKNFGGVLKPILDRMWSAAGQAGSPSYRNGVFDPKL